MTRYCSRQIEVSRIFVSRSSRVLTPLPFFYCKKQIDVSFPCVCPVIDTEFRRNIVKVVHSYFDNVMTKFMINNRTDA